jgi:HNH endonuclease
MGVFKCPDCSVEFACKQNLNNHVEKAICKKPVIEHRCVCGKLFCRPCRLATHAAKCSKAKASPASSSVQNGDNVNINGVNSASEVLDFDKTSEQAVIDFVSSDEDARQRLCEAFECGCLHEEITRLTHFEGPLENRNVVSVDNKGAFMKVIYRGVQLNTDVARCVMLIIERNVRIANDPVVRDVLDVSDGDVLSVAQTARQYKYETQQVRMVLENSGLYMMIHRPQPPEDVKNPRRVWNTRTRNCVAAQQGWQCNICDVNLPSAFDIDHEVPLFKGGADEYCNLQALCVPCHRNKTAAERSKGVVLLPSDKGIESTSFIVE